MSCLGYIAGSLIAPSFAGYLINNGLINRENKRIVKEIEEMIIRFNVKFYDTEVESNFFVDYLEQHEVSKLIFERVFKSYKSSSESFDVLSSELGKEAVCYVNEMKERYKHPQIKIPNDFKDYFQELFKVLLDYRDSLLSIKEEALVSILDDSLNSSKNEIIEAIEDQKGSDYLLQGKINEIEVLIDKGFYDDAIELISSLFETVDSMNNEQRAKLLYQKARVFINTDQMPKALEIKMRISHYRSNSRYLDEIDYWVGFHNSNLIMVKEAIGRLRDKGECEEVLTLKLTNFYLVNGDYSKVTEKIANGTNEVAENYKKYEDAYYQMGVVCYLKGNYSIASEQFKKAQERKNRIIYDYYYAMSCANNLLDIVKPEISISNDVKEEAEFISSLLKKLMSFTRNKLKGVRTSYWWTYLNLLGLYQHSLIIDEYPLVDEDIMHEESMAVIVSEAYYLEKRYIEARPFLEKIWKLDPLFLSRLMHVYSELDMWDLIDNIFKNEISHLYDSKGNVFFYKVESQAIKGKIDDAVNLIRGEGNRYKQYLRFQKQVLDFANEYGAEDLYVEYSNYILDNLGETDSETRVSIAKSFYNHSKMNLVQSVLKPLYKYSQEASELFLHSLGDVNPKSENYAELRKATYDLYDEGNRSEYILQMKFYIELLTQSYENANDLLEEYAGYYGKDMFYCLNKVQNTIFSESDYDATEECEQLIKVPSLKHQLMVAQYYGYKGRWNEAKVHLSNSFYIYYDKIGEEEILGFVQIYLLNTHHETNEVEYVRACNDSVIVLKTKNGGIKNVSIISNEALIHNNGEELLGCTNYKGTSDQALMLKALSKKDLDVEIDGVTYTVKEILNLHTYHFRFFYNKLLTEFPENKLLIPVYGETIEELVGKMQDIMSVNQENAKSKMGFYNFEVETGVPISYLSGKNNGRYLDIIDFLLVNDKQCFYSTYSTLESINSKYVLSISSIIILNYFGMLGKLKSIADKIVVSQSIKPFIRKGLNDSIKYDSVVSTAYLDENGDFKMIESTEENKERRKIFWTDLMIAINSFQLLTAESVSKEFYDALHEIVDVSEFEAIDLAESDDYTLVCDDLFISKVCESINGKGPILNALGLLYIENLLSYDELLAVVQKASKYKMINGVNHKMLYDVYLGFVNEYGTEAFNRHSPIVYEIFDNLFNESTNGFNQYLYQLFINETRANYKTTGLLYKLLEKPLGFTPYEEFVANALSNIKIEFEMGQ